MNDTYSAYPRQNVLWPGAVLGSVAHALFVARHPEFAYEQSWDGPHYNVQDSAGSRGCITFSDDRFVAAFFAERSERNPFRSGQTHDPVKFLSGAPAELSLLAQHEALQYLLQTWDGSIVPIITAAFWGDGAHTYCTGAEEWDGVFKHGAFLVRNQLLEWDDAVRAWQTDYELSSAEVAIVEAVSIRRINSPIDEIQLTSSEREVLLSTAVDDVSFEASRESLNELRITI